MADTIADIMFGAIEKAMEAAENTLGVLFGALIDILVGFIGGDFGDAPALTIFVVMLIAMGGMIAYKMR